MKDLILKGRTIPYNKKSFTPTIHASAKRNLIEITHLQGFSQLQLLKLKQWITTYKKTNSTLLTVSYVSSIFLYENKKSSWPDPSIKNTAIPALPYHRVKYITQHGILTIHSILESQQLLYNIHSLGGTYTAKIIGLAQENFLKISGESYHSYIMEFYEELFDWLNYYLKYKQPTTFRVEFWMIYFNTSASRRFFELFTILENYQKKQQLPYGNITVYWHYDERDVDMLEAGEEYQKDVAINFELAPVDDIMRNRMNN